MPTSPPTITNTAPIVRSGDKVAFSAAIDGFISWLIGIVPSLNSIASACYNNAVESNTSAQNAAASASAAQAFSGAQKWVAKTYADGDVAWSPIDYAVYRKTGAGASSVDPSNPSESTRWRLAAGGNKMMVLTNTKPAGTSPEASTGVGAPFQQLVLNTTNVNDISGASLSSNQVVLPAGQYDIFAWQAGLSVSSKLVLNNVSDGNVVVASSNASDTLKVVRTRLSLTSQKTVDLRIATATSNSSTLGYALNVGGLPEIYTSLTITKIG